CVDPGRLRWKCFGCGEHGDAATLVMKLQGVGFPESIRIVAELAGVVVPSGRSFPLRRGSRPPATIATKAPSKPPERSSGLPLTEAVALVEQAARRLHEGNEPTVLSYLRGRGLTEETIHAARLGGIGGVVLPRRDGGTWRVSGTVIPWFDG